MKRYDVREFGAVPDREEKQTAALQAALDACFLGGGGTVEIPAGTFRTGGLRVRSHTTLLLKEGAALVGTRVPGDYDILKDDALEPIDPERNAYCVNRWNNAILSIMFARDVAVRGEKGSLICGSNCYDPAGEEGYRGPHAITAFYSRGLSFSGYTVRDSANWAHNIRHCGNIDARDLHVFAGHDGFHIRACENVTVADSEFITGDDAVAGHGNLNVRVSNCVLNTACSSFRFGATNLLVDGCRFTGPAVYPWRGCLTDDEKIRGANEFSVRPSRMNSLSMFTYFAEDIPDIRYEPRNVVFQNCTVEGVERLVQYNLSGGDKWQQARPLFDLTLKNITARGLSEPTVLFGPEDVPLRAELENVSIETAEDYPYEAVFRTGWVKELSLRNVRIKTRAPHLIENWGRVERLTCEAFECSVPEADWCAEGSGEFWSQDI